LFRKGFRGIPGSQPSSHPAFDDAVGVIPALRRRCRRSPPGRAIALDFIGERLELARDILLDGSRQSPEYLMPGAGKLPKSQ